MVDLVIFDLDRTLMDTAPELNGEWGFSNRMLDTAVVFARADR